MPLVTETTTGAAAVTIAPATADDAGELLTLQRAAYVTEAQLHDEPRLPPLTQTLDELLAELRRPDVVAVKALLGHRVVGGGRARVDGRTAHIGRLTVAPDLQGRGIGTALLTALEQATAGRVDAWALFTGERSAANLRLYERCGYARVRTEALTPTVTVVHLEKPAR